MTAKELILKFITAPHNLDMGAGKLAARFGCSKADIYKAKEEARKALHAAEVADLQNVINDQFQTIAKYIGSESTDEGCRKKFESPRPLSPDEIKEVAGVDDVNTTVARVWDKQLPSGIWTYSIDVRYLIKDFYNKEELIEKLKQLMPDLTPYSIPILGRVEEEALIILLADDHVGSVNVTNMYDAPTIPYRERLRLVSDEVKLLGKSFDEVHIVSLGDQMNGWNSQTTRGGHEVKSLSNKDQFDLYTAARVEFYNDIFSSGLSENYFVHDVENSNHSGNGMSYMANKFLEMYLEGKFPSVIRRGYTDPIDGFEYGQHVVLIGHGKDEKFMKKPMPAVLNTRTDLYIYEFLANKMYNPTIDNITLYKGDLHQLGIQMGKFGRYVNVPALCGNSDFSDINFGKPKGGALLEILDKNSYRITSKPIWF